MPKLPFKKLGVVVSVMIVILLIVTFRDVIFNSYPAIVMHYKIQYNQMATPEYLEQLRTYAKDTLKDPLNDLNYSQLIEWEHKHLQYWGGELQVRPEMPIEILYTNKFGTLTMRDFTFRIAIYCSETETYTVYLNDEETVNDVMPYSWNWFGYTVGRCGEFALLYTGLLLANDYRVRLVVDCSVQTDSRKAGDHVWNEVFINGTWIHIDPTEGIIDSPDLYSNPDKWNKNVNLVYAIQGDIITDVTETYR